MLNMSFRPQETPHSVNRVVISPAQGQLARSMDQPVSKTASKFGKATPLQEQAAVDEVTAALQKEVAALQKEVQEQVDD